MYCKSNVRRVINYTQTEPINKYDLWLSENARYNEDGELEYDNDGQPACDLILKLFRHGRWEPVVGFNTTAANKINIVPNHEENHVPLFLNQSQSPDELFDAGTMTDVLTNGDYVDWETILGNEDFQHAWDVTVNNLNIRRAGHEILGGVWADTFSNIAANGFAQCKFKNNSDSNLYVSGDDILGAIGGSSTGTIDTDLLYRSFYNSPSIRKGWNETQGSPSAIKPRFELNGSTTPDNRGKFLKLKSANDPWWGSVEHNYGETDNCFDWVDLKDWFDESLIYDLPIGSAYGINTLKMTIFQGTEYERVAYTHILDHYTSSTGEGKVCVTKFYDEGNAFGNKYGLNWVEPNLDFLSDVVINNPSNGLSLLFNGTVWTNGSVNNYTAGAGIDIDIQNHEISLNIESVELNTPPSSSLSITNSITSGQEDSIVISGTDYTKVIGPYEVFDYPTTIEEYSFDFSQIQSFQNTNPIYLKIAFKLPITFTSGTLYICDSLINNEVPGGKYIVTIQFGVVKFEKINTFSNA